MSALLKVPPEVLETLARLVKIEDHTGGATRPWIPNVEQLKAWAVVAKGGWTFLAKGRQIGMTTAMQFYVLLWCLINDQAGNRVRAAIYVDTDKKLTERETFARTVLACLPDLFKGCDVNSDRVMFPNGSSLVFGTGSGSGEGRSGTFQLLLLSEVPFWKNPGTYSALMPALARGCQCIVDTTIDTAAPNGALIKSLFTGKNSYEKVFFPIQLHEEYRSAPDLISDDEWERLKLEGFTIREAAAWWWTDALPNLAASDISRLMREFPQRVEHMWSKGVGRFIPITPLVVEPVGYIACGLVNVPWWLTWEQTSGQLVVAVDTGKGVEKDRSAVVILDKRDLRIVAAFASASLDAFEFGDVVAGLLKAYRAPKPAPLAGIIEQKQPMHPDLMVEENGIGEAMVLRLREHGLAVTPKWTDEASKPLGLTMARQAILSKAIYGPQVLADECDDLHQHPETGNFKGKKDMLMAVGFGLLHIRSNPFKVPVVALPLEGYIDGRAMIRAQRGGKGGGW